LIVKRDSIRDIPVSLDPTTTILVLLDTFVYANIFLVIILREKQLSS
jgi:hypothetical protein